MDFTREPVIETIVTPKEGCKLVIRNSKGVGQEEFFVDSVEIVSFGHSFFFRSLERPKNFLVPVADYEILEVREARVVLKNSSFDGGAIKIGAGKSPKKTTKAASTSTAATVPAPAATNTEQSESTEESKDSEYPRMDKKRERRRSRRRRGRDEKDDASTDELASDIEEEDKSDKSQARTNKRSSTRGGSTDGADSSAAESNGRRPVGTLVEINTVGMLLPPPKQLISETIAKYKEFIDPALTEKQSAKAVELSPETAALDEENSDASALPPDEWSFPVALVDEVLPVVLPEFVEEALEEAESPKRTRKKSVKVEVEKEEIEG